MKCIYLFKDILTLFTHVSNIATSLDLIYFFGVNSFLWMYFVLGFVYLGRYTDFRGIGHLGLTWILLYVQILIDQGSEQYLLTCATVPICWTVLCAKVRPSFARLLFLCCFHRSCIYDSSSSRLACDEEHSRRRSGARQVQVPYLPFHNT